MSDSDTNVKLPNDDQVFGIVKDLVGDNKLKARCLDGEERLCRIPGRMRKKVWIREDDVIIVDPWDWQDEKADVAYRYDNKEEDKLREKDLLTDKDL